MKKENENMSLYASASGESAIAPIDAGTYPAVCYGLIDIGLQWSETYKKSSPKVVILWELPTEKIEIGGEEKSRAISQTYTASLNERAALRRDLAAWRGRDFTDGELERFDLKTIVGVPCMLNVIHKESDGRTYANIGAVMKLPRGMEAPAGTLPRIVFDLDTDELSMMDEMPEWIVKRIKQSESYKARIQAAEGAADFADDGDLPF